MILYGTLTGVAKPAEPEAASRDNKALAGPSSKHPPTQDAPSHETAVDAAPTGDKGKDAPTAGGRKSAPKATSEQPKTAGDAVLDVSAQLPPVASTSSEGAAAVRGRGRPRKEAGPASAVAVAPQQPAAASAGGLLFAQQPDEQLVRQLLQPAAAASNPRAFVMLQEQYVQLQTLYQQLKGQKIQDLEGLLDEQNEYVDELSASVQKLADHWKKEAEKQAELGRKAGSAEFVARAEKMQVRLLMRLSRRFYYTTARVTEGLSEGCLMSADPCNFGPIHQEENLALRQSLAALEEQVVQLRKEVAERDARASASASHVLALRTQFSAQLGEVATEAAAAAGERDRLRAELEAQKQQKQQFGGGARLQLTPAPGSGLKNMSLQFPTPPAPPVPSPGIACQFPSPPAGALTLLPASPAPPPVPSAAALPLRRACLGLGMPPASAAMKRAALLSPQPREDETPPAAVASLGSPVEGLHDQQQQPAEERVQHYEEEARALAPEGLRLPSCEAAQPSFPKVDLDPSSALKAHSALQQWAAAAAATATLAGAPVCSEEQVGLLLPGSLDQLMSAAKTAGSNPVGSGSQQQQLSAGMAQLVASASAVAAALGDQAASRLSQRLEQDSAQEEPSNQVSSNAAGLKVASTPARVQGAAAVGNTASKTPGCV